MGNASSFTGAVDDAIRSSTPSILGDSSVPSYASLIDSAISSSSASSGDAEFDLIFRTLDLSGPDDFIVTPEPSQQAQTQQDNVTSPPRDTVNLQQTQLQTLQNPTQTQGTRINGVTPPVLAVNSDKSKSSPGDADTKNESQMPKDGPTPHIPIAAQTFTFRELAVATKNFRPEYLLGEGCFKRVYKGRLEKTGQVVAVKQLDRNGGQGNREFLVEVLMLNLVHHPNLVNLIGYCADYDQRLTVYEFMPLGSLEDHLHDLPPDKEPLDWNTRVKIAAGAAKGLEYLHNRANPPVMYRNLKPSNILLGEGYHPKLSDFALAKLGPFGDKTHVSTQITGTDGYIAPEYAMTGLLTLKSDVYCFGVVLLELITGRKAINNTRADGEQSLVAWAKPIFKDRKKFPKMADPLLQGRYPMRGLYQALAVAAMCLQAEPARRPPICDVVTALKYLASQEYHPNVPNESNRVGPSTPRMRGNDRTSMADGVDSPNRGWLGSPSTHRNSPVFRRRDSRDVSVASELGRNDNGGGSGRKWALDDFERQESQTDSQRDSLEP